MSMTTEQHAEVVDRYFAAIRAHDAEAVAGCFAEDAVLVSAAGTVQGRDAIAEFYATIAFALDDIEPRPGPYVVDGARVAVEIDLRIGDGSSQVADFFEVRGGLIDRLVIYLLPSP